MLTPAQRKVLEVLKEGPKKPAPGGLYPKGMQRATVDALERAGYVLVTRVQANRVTFIRTEYRITEAGLEAISD